MQQLSRCVPPGRVRRRGAAVLLAAFAAVAALLSPGAVRAQAGEVGGTVVAANSLQPLSGAQISVVGTNNGVVAGPDGRFVLHGVAGAQVELQATMLGYKTATQTVAVGTMDVRFELAQSAISLNELVVTGTPQAEQKRALGNVVSTVDAAAIVAKAPVSTVDEVLNGRVAGVSILSSTGEVGGASRIHIRGATSFSLSNTPLIYIDGIRVNNSEATGPQTQSFGSSTISRWNDLDPNEIESIQVIKGPAAATLYGTEAAHGVIQIITKHGQSGAPQFHLQVRGGGNSFSNPEGRLWTNYFMVNNQLQSIDLTQLEQRWTAAADSMGVSPTIFRTGGLASADLNVSGGNGGTHYFLSGGLEQNQGVVPSNQVRKGNARMNVTVTPGEHWSANGSFGYVVGRTDMGPESGWGGIPWTTYYMRPDKINTYHRGFYSYTPDAYNTAFQLWQDLSRFTGSVQLHYNPTSWFTNRVTVGLDQVHQGDNEIDKNVPQYAYQDSYFAIGGHWTTAWDINYTTVDYAGNITADLSPNFKSTTSIGAQYYRKHQDWISAGNSDFPVPGLTSITATTGQPDLPTGDYINNITAGVFAQEQIGWLNRRFLTVALRRDQNSAFGTNYGAAYYPKVSGSWVLTDEPFFHVSALNTLKLRAAYGATGEQPDQFAALRTFQPVPGPIGGTVTPQNVGNPDLGPERTAGLEAGFDAGVANDRIGIEFTYFNQVTKDAILLRQIAPSTGFSGSQYVNAGRVDNNGLEVNIHGSPIVRPAFGWDLGVNFSTNNNTIKSLGSVTDQNYVQAGSYVRHEIGYPVGSWFEKKLVSATLNADGTTSNLMCDNGSGGTVDCANAPQVFLGRNIPKFQGGVNSTFTLFRNLELFGQIDFETGFSKLDGNERVRCWFFAECLANWDPTSADPVTVAGYQHDFVSGLIHKAGFARLRELSATYHLPHSLTQRLGVNGASLTVAGRNLAIWTKYPGLDPEATFNGGSRGGSYSLWEQDVFPQLEQFTATLNLTF